MKPLEVTATINGQEVKQTVTTPQELKQLLNSVDDFGADKITNVEAL